MAKPRVFVSSTYYDLRHIRNSLEAFIDTIGFEAVLFESGDIPFRHDLPLDESCYAEIQSCHILVLIIGGRYGSGSSEKEVSSTGDRDKLYRAYNSITKREYEAARIKDIPIFIFVEENVLGEHRTYKANRENKTIRYAHVDNIGVFELLDDILVQRRNNYIRGFEKFDDIAGWLRDQWAGLFAEFLTKKRVEKSVQDLSGQIEQLRQVTAVLKEYTESIMRKIEPENFRRIISAQEKKLLAAKARRFSSEGMIRFLRRTYDLKLTPTKLLSVFAGSSSLQGFLKGIGLSGDVIEEFMKEHFVPAKHDYMDLRNRYVLNDEERGGGRNEGDLDLEGVDLDGP